MVYQWCTKIIIQVSNEDEYQRSQVKWLLHWGPSLDIAQCLDGLEVPLWTRRLGRMVRLKNGEIRNFMGGLNQIMGIWLGDIQLLNATFWLSRAMAHCAKSPMPRGGSEGKRPQNAQERLSNKHENRCVSKQKVTNAWGILGLCHLSLTFKGISRHFFGALDWELKQITVRGL